MSLIEQLQRGVDTNEPPDKTDRIMTEAADEIARLRAELDKEEKFTMAAMDKAKTYQAALEEIIDESKWSVSKGRLSWAVRIARKALAKEGE